MKKTGSQAAPEVITTWVEVHQLFQGFRGERREKLQQVADKLGISFKVARRRLRNYEAMVKVGGGSRLKARAQEMQDESQRQIVVKSGLGGVRIIKKSVTDDQS